MNSTILVEIIFIQIVLSSKIIAKLLRETYLNLLKIPRTTAGLIAGGVTVLSIVGEFGLFSSLMRRG